MTTFSVFSWHCQYNSSILITSYAHGTHNTGIFKSKHYVRMFFFLSGFKIDQECLSVILTSAVALRQYAAYIHQLSHFIPGLNVPWSRHDVQTLRTVRSNSMTKSLKIQLYYKQSHFNILN